ncbi:hypothetical protein PoB_001014300 [Plakobranchus ocellatus]|uniref:Uncharacterized protein n=1 Tax=Plakobranchus ocellatus TaxID=259542 RepID=A0AAV3YMQ9_9GAST|nr:hypothetical protein PoB_001014300 [Plakobranchus ocellatus]
MEFSLASPYSEQISSTSPATAGWREGGKENREESDRDVKEGEGRLVWADTLYRCLSRTMFAERLLVGAQTDCGCPQNERLLRVLHVTEPRACRRLNTHSIIIINNNDDEQQQQQQQQQQ